MRKEGETCLVELKVQLLVFVREFREDVDLVLLLLVAVGERYRAVIHAACAVPVTRRSREKKGEHTACDEPVADLIPCNVSEEYDALHRTSQYTLVWLKDTEKNWL